MITRDVDRAIDECILRPSVGTKARVRRALTNGSCPSPVLDLIDALLEEKSRTTPLTAQELGGHLASRLLSRGFVLAIDHRRNAYALADAVRSHDVLSVYRWQYVASLQAGWILSNSIRRVIDQSDQALRSIAQLDPEARVGLEWEHKLIPMPKKFSSA